MSTNSKPLPGRHRAAVDARSPLRAPLPVWIGGSATALVALTLVWQVLW